MNILKQFVIFLASAGCCTTLNASLASAQDAQEARSYERYFAQEVARARRIKREAMLIETERTIARLEAEFNTSKHKAFLRAIADMNLPPERGIGLWTRYLGIAHPGANMIALDALADYGNEAASATPEAIRLLKSETPGVVIKASEFIVAAAPRSPDVVDSLADRLTRPNTRADVRLALIDALAKFGPSAVGAVPTLTSQIDAGNTRVAFAAFNAIGAIREQPPIGSSDATLLNGDNAMRVFDGMRKNLIDEPASIVALQTLLDGEPRPHIRAMAISMLKDFGVSDSNSLRVLLSSAASDDDFIAELAVEAIRRAGPTSPAAVGALLSALGADRDQTVIAAARALANATIMSPDSIPLILAQLERANGNTGYRRVGAYLDLLRSMGHEARGARTFVTDLMSEDAAVLQNRNPVEAQIIRRYVLLTLGDIGAEEASIGSIISVLANSDHPAMLAAAAHAAAGLESGHRQVVPWLISLLDDEFVDFPTNLRPIDSMFVIPDDDLTSVRLEAIRALRKMGSAAKSAIPVLRRRAADPIVELFNYPPYQREAALAADEISR